MCVFRAFAGTRPARRQWHESAGWYPQSLRNWQFPGGSRVSPGFQGASGTQVLRTCGARDVRVRLLYICEGYGWLGMASHIYNKRICNFRSRLAQAWRGGDIAPPAPRAKFCSSLLGQSLGGARSAWLVRTRTGCRTSGQCPAPRRRALEEQVEPCRWDPQGCRTWGLACTRSWPHRRQACRCAIGVCTLLSYPAPRR